MSYKRIEELVILCKQGDRNALEELINTYQRLIGKYTNTYFIKGYEDEDLSQVAKLAIIQAIQKYDITKGANFTGFLDIVLRNTFTSIINKKSNTEGTVSLNNILYDDNAKEYMDIFADDENIEESFEYKEQRLQLREALNKLSQDEREILIAAYGGYGVLKEYAKKTGRSYASCRYRKIRALEKIRKILK